MLRRVMPGVEFFVMRRFPLLAEFGHKKNAAGMRSRDWEIPDGNPCDVGV
jgi:hypothetical protein